MEGDEARGGAGLVDWLFLVPPNVDKKLLIVLLLNVLVGVVSGTIFVIEGVRGLYLGGKNLSIFGGASVFYGYALLMFGWRRLLKKYYRPPPSD